MTYPPPSTQSKQHGAVLASLQTVSTASPSTSATAAGSTSGPPTPNPCSASTSKHPVTDVGIDIGDAASGVTVRHVPDIDAAWSRLLLVRTRSTGRGASIFPAAGC